MKFKSNARYNEPVESGTIYDGRIGNIRISVHRIIHCEGWYLSSETFGISRMQLKNDTLMGAISEAKEALKSIVDGLSKDVNAFCEEEIEISRY